MLTHVCDVLLCLAPYAVQTLASGPDLQAELQPLAPRLLALAQCFTLGGLAFPAHA